jgi:ketosteroid isomerase-like protein
MAITSKDVARLRAAYEAIRAGDPQPLTDLMDENVRWIGDISQGDPPPECKNRAEASEVLKRAATRVRPRELESISVYGDRILAVARWQPGAGPEGRDRVYNLITIRDGRITEMQDFHDGAAAERTFKRSPSSPTPLTDS